MRARDRLGSNGSSSTSSGGDLHLERLLPDFSFLRISLDHVTLARESAYLHGLQKRGAIFGYTLKYSFPCPDGVSSSLRARVILRASSFSSNAIFFRHKRVNLVKLNSDVIPFWARSSLTLDLEVQLNVQGKYSTRPLARCSVPLEDLLLPPFAISRDFDFLGAQFEGSALVKIDLGSQQRPLMERLERWRGETEGVGSGVSLGAAGPDSTFTVPAARHTRSRSGSRCRSRCSESGGQENGNGNGEEEDDDVFYDAPSSGGGQSVMQQRGRRGVSPFRERNASLPSLSGGGRMGRGEERGIYARPVATTRRSSASSSASLTPLPRQSLRVRLRVHAAHGLPMARDHRGLLMAPSALISVRGRDGELRSPVHPPSRSPRFDWACTFDVSGERRNVVVKVLHHDAEGNDVPLGFVSLPLPTASVHEADYELVELGAAGGGGHDASMITLSVESSASSRPPSKLDGSFLAPVPVAPGPAERLQLQQQYGGGGGGYDFFAGGGGARTNSRLSAASSMTLSGAGPPPQPPRPPSASDAPYESRPLQQPRRRSLSPDILILETREEIEGRLRRNMNELDILMSRLDRR